MMKSYFFIRTIPFFVLLALFPKLLFAVNPDPFMIGVSEETRTIAPGEVIIVKVDAIIPPGHYLYKDSFSVKIQTSEFQIKSIQSTPPHTKVDPFFNKSVEIFEESASLTAEFVGPSLKEGDYTLKLTVTYQGCSPQLCYPQKKKEFVIPVTVSGSGTTSMDTPLSNTNLENRSFWGLLFFSFLGGLFSAFTPCVLPIIPITLAFIGVRKEGSGIRKNFILSLCLVLSMSLTYAILGTLAARLGKSLGFMFQSPYFLLAGVVLFIVFSLSMFGLFEIQLPLALRNWMAKKGGQGIGGAIISGMTVGFLAAPCIGPVIASILLYIGKTQNVWKGFWSLLIYGFGLGFPFLVVGTYYHRLAAKVHGGPYMVWVKRVFAIILLVPAFYYGKIAWTEIKKPTSNHFWMHSEKEAFQKAQTENKLVFIDFYADWCIPCVGMEEKTFSKTKTQEFLKQKFVPLKVDCSNDDQVCQDALKKYDVYGFPTFLVVDPKTGKILKSLIGEDLSPKELIKKLSE